MRHARSISAAALIAEIHASDVMAAREILRSALKVARDGWIPAQALADAMIQELVELSAIGASPERSAALLRSIAALLEGASDRSQAN